MEPVHRLCYGPAAEPSPGLNRNRSWKSRVATELPTRPADLRLYDGDSDRIARGRLRIPLLLATLLAAALVPVTTLFDVSISRWLGTSPMRGDLSKAIELSEVYGHGIGVIVILMLVAQLAPRKRWCIPRLATLALGGGAVAMVMKMFVLRGRPGNLNLHVASHDAAWRWLFDWKLNHVAAFDSALRSFPSGHTAMAIGLTIGLCLMFPRGRVMFALLLGLSMAERLTSYAHFASDVIAGLAIGLLWTYICLSPRFLGALFDHIEPQGQGFERRREASLRSRAA